MTGRIRLGFLTPSSNSVLEPLTTALLDDLPEVTAHFSRLRVTDIALTETSVAQFDESEMLRALHAHRDVDFAARKRVGRNGANLRLQLPEKLR